MNQLEIFSSPEFGRIRAVDYNGEPLFMAKDVADALRYSNTKAAILRHCRKAVLLKNKDINSGGNGSLPLKLNNYGAKFIPESDVYALIVGSEKKDDIAEKFRVWVFEEVLPQIRKTGGYIPISQDMDEQTIMLKGFEIAMRTLKEKESIIANQKNRLVEQEKKIALDAPKVKAWEQFIDADGLFNPRTICEYFGFNSAVAFNKALVNDDIQYKNDGTYTLYAKYRGNEYTKIVARTIKLEDGRDKVIKHMKWTPKGVEFLENYFNNKRNGTK